ncbi:hypothetical protein Pedsa_1440 [Pseudopedobacter saltans DSM 12145]|uniref:Uncharacterized protein n=1 Tax=Pseudopedobacter saltans (strain ATCC 51119 / DSM 12145 / JCM 21818 / CCUG 39354 / LMG 10337 / NBRC 100064 / NCIMB 13643) TaxID=762903 RepID=F0S4L1_PSESL|nr:hypothetical protein Pedsa_1440 [Pseudopedobacter saltans DSM 12145]
MLTYLITSYLIYFLFLKKTVLLSRTHVTLLKYFVTDSFQNRKTHATSIDLRSGI